MIDLSGASSGAIGAEGRWFSELLRAAAASEFTGGFLIDSRNKMHALFFQDGNPVNASGVGFTQHHLGELMILRGAITKEQLRDALKEQQAAQGTKPLLGALLVSRAGIDPVEVKRTIRIQTEARVESLFALTSGTWKSAPGEDPRLKSIGVPTNAWTILLRGITHAPREELAIVRDALLGKAIKISNPKLLSKFPLEEGHQKMAKYLEKPRKPDQLERALNNRTAVRGFLRVLMIEKALDLLSVKKAIPIPKATLLKGNVNFSVPGLHDQSFDEMENSDEVKVFVVPKPKTRDIPLPIIKDIEKLHERIENGVDHFELLGFGRTSHELDTSMLRRQFTELAKKFHPDAMPDSLTEELSTKAREVSARLNEAYTIIADQTTRASYLAMLEDKRIRGDARKAELIREASTKSQMGIVMLRKKDFKRAKEFFTFASESDPETKKYAAQLAWAEFSDPTADRDAESEKALPILKAAVEQNHQDGDSHFYLAVVFKTLGNTVEAEKHFRACTRLTPGHAEAKSELRVIQMRKKKEPKDRKTSGIGKFFKR